MNKILIISTLIFSGILLSACEQDPTNFQAQIEQAKINTAYSFSHPEEVGTLPDGKKVYVVHRDVAELMGLGNNHYVAHHIDTIYLADGDLGTTINHMTEGKFSHNEVRAILPKQ